MEWQIVPTTQWEKDKKWYEKKRPNELAAVIQNLGQYLKYLRQFPNSKAFMAGFMHTEQAGVIALDQSGGGKGLEETRLYVYADDGSRSVYIITVGNKDSQSSDVLMAKEFVEQLRGQSSK